MHRVINGIPFIYFDDKGPWGGIQKQLAINLDGLLLNPYHL